MLGGVGSHDELGRERGLAGVNLFQHIFCHLACQKGLAVISGWKEKGDTGAIQGGQPVE